ncbi:MAG TPA: iron-sulfur cluster assembly scaffold protein [Bryobacteraceae bacterium]
MLRFSVASMYNAKLLEHFQNPRNVGELEPAPGVVRVEMTNPACGDIMRLSARFRDGIVEDVKYKVRGCTASIAAGSVLTELMMGAPRATLAAIRASDIDAALGGLEPASKHAAILCVDAVKRLLEAHRV